MIRNNLIVVHNELIIFWTYESIFFYNFFHPLFWDRRYKMAKSRFYNLFFPDANSRLARVSRRETRLYIEPWSRGNHIPRVAGIHLHHARNFDHRVHGVAAEGVADLPRGRHRVAICNTRDLLGDGAVGRYWMETAPAVCFGEIAPPIAVFTALTWIRPSPPPPPPAF